MRKLNELALFTGGAGGLLGTRLLGWRTICAVEINRKRREILLARQADGSFDEFPIWDDVRTFPSEIFRGKINVITGGFPCQPFSTASRGHVTAEDRWPDMLRIVREIAPCGVLAENVQSAPIDRAAADLRALGYSTRTYRASAAALGAPHRRPRHWVLAYHHHQSKSAEPEHDEVASLQAPAFPVWRQPPPRSILGVDDGVAGRMDRLQALGEGQVPGVVAILGRILEQDLIGS